MSIEAKKTKKIEILVSTLNQTSLEFLDEMLINNSTSDFNVLIIHQGETLNVEKKSSSIRIINSKEFGLSKSRNLAIENAKDSICLFADDDVKYLPNLHDKIVATFDKYPEADIITFQMIDEKSRFFKLYEDIVLHDKKTIKTVNSVVIAFRNKRVLESDVRFDENFGLGAEFQTADEYIFLRNALSSNLKVYFEPVVILEHKYESSGRPAGSDRLVYARAALFYKYSGVLGYLRLCKYLYLVYKSNMIKTNEIIYKFKVGLRGIKKYRELRK